MLASSPQAPSSIRFVPRQVMLQQNGAAMVKVDGKESRKEKKERKKRSSETSQLDGANVGRMPLEGLGRDALLRSIAAFLDSNGFSKTLSVLLSEAQLEMGCWESSSVNLEDLFGKLLDPSKCDTEAIINWLRDQVSKNLSNLQDVITNHSSVKTDKNKRKKSHQVDGNGIETLKSETEKVFDEGSKTVEKLAIDFVQGELDGVNKVESELRGLSANNAEISEEHVHESNEQYKVKKKKRKEASKICDEKLAIEGKINEGKKVDSELENLSPKNSDIPEKHHESNEQRKVKKKKHKEVLEVCDELPRDIGNHNEIVKAKKDKLVACEDNSVASNVKEKTEKWKARKVKGTDPATLDPLDDNVSTHKIKKKKQKSPSDVSKLISGEAAEKKSADKVKDVEINTSDFGYQNVLVSEDTEVTKEVSKKRKLLDSEKNDGEIVSKKSKVDSKVNAEKVETGKIVESDRSTVDINTPVPKRNAKENKDTTENAGEQLQHSAKSMENGSLHNSKNEVVGQQLENGSLGKKGGRSVELKSNTPFQRVKVDDAKFVDERLKDNSYWAKDGADSGYGAKAQEVLGQVKGRNFRHEKTKKKRGSYRGGQIDLQSHSVKFTYSDDDE
ncbi:nucleolar and coiled-body phosphoprotein 1-like [Zingiber officinale]|uniref:nucleolar and coiled-body phosphoprotein 1-like n=1 Tax=Zingiber officinale TaxID=94328 RepID=UPI001C4D41AA|nr:nucleolar and coiled-body phosphoprotein 1-like [Zingiber officinale]